MRAVRVEVIGIASIGTGLTLLGFFLAFQTWRSERAAIGLDVYAGLAKGPNAKAKMDQARTDLKPPRDARLWELEADRLMKLDLERNAVAVRDALSHARDLAPMRPSIRMRETYVALRQSESPDMFNDLYMSWYKLAPHDVTNQDWRLSIAASGWDRLGPEARRMALADAEDLCMRWGAKRTIEFVATVAPGPALAAALRLERVKQKCAGDSR
jgi:hypothetical protein